MEITESQFRKFIREEINEARKYDDLYVKK
jgi:hypothetical protein